MIKIPIVYTGKGELPKHATHLSAGMDIRANIPSSITLQPLERIIIPTGLSISLPEGYEAQVRPRSGLAAKYGVTVLNSPGTIDADYRGDIGVILVNLSQDSFTIEPEDRIAQLVVAQYSQIKWELAKSLPDSTRGEGGFGSTGNK
jgi:dUTP pyrophosphatase